MKEPERRFKNAQSVIEALEAADITYNTAELSKTQKKRILVSLILVVSVVVMVLLAHTVNASFNRHDQVEADFAHVLKSQNPITELRDALNKKKIADAQVIFDKLPLTHPSKELEDLLFSLYKAQTDMLGNPEVIRDDLRKLIRLTELRTGRTLEIFKPLNGFCTDDLKRQCCTKETVGYAKRAYELAAENEMKFGKLSSGKRASLHNLTTRGAVILAMVLLQVDPLGPETEAACITAAKALQGDSNLVQDSLLLDFWIEYGRWQLHAENAQGASKSVQLAADGFSKIAVATKQPVSLAYLQSLCALALSPRVSLDPKTQYSIEKLLKPHLKATSPDVQVKGIALTAYLYRTSDPQRSKMILENAVMAPGLSSSPKAFLLHQLTSFPPPLLSNPKRLQYAFEALRLCEQDPTLQADSFAVAYKVIGDVLCQNGRIEEAKSYFKKALASADGMQKGAPGSLQERNRHLTQVGTLIALAGAQKALGEQANFESTLKNCAEILALHHGDFAFDYASTGYKTVIAPGKQPSRTSSAAGRSH